jgi:multiple sugar transport system substrate-binding protein
MTRIHRRKFLKLSGAGAIATGTGGLAAILASGRAPAYAQATSLHWLRWADFVPASDKLLKEKIAPQCEKALGIKLNVEMINANDLQARTTAAIQSGTGPDIIMLQGTWPQLYADSLADVRCSGRDRQGAGRLFRPATGDRHCRRQMDRGSLGGWWRARRLSQIVAGSSRR